LGVVFSTFVLLAAGTFLAPAAKADLLTLTLQQSTYNVNPGDSFTVYGTLAHTELHPLSNLSAASGLFSPSIYSSASFDEAFLAYLNSPTNFSTTSLTLYSGAILDLGIKSTAAIGSSQSTYILMGALDRTSWFPRLLSSNTSFTVNVGSTRVPEPSSLDSLALMTGVLAGLGWFVRRRSAGRA